MTHLDINDGLAALIKKMGYDGDLYLVPGSRHGAPVFGPQFVQRV